jgi:hypothetical protein
MHATCPGLLILLELIIAIIFVFGEDDDEAPHYVKFSSLLS